VFKKEKKDISKMSQEVLQRYYKNEMERGEVKTAIEPGITAEVDEYTFPSVITNLVDNALKYSFDTKAVYIELKKVNSDILLAVKDAGCGISAEDKQKIFSRFFRAGNEETRRSKGTGLGLYIVDYIVKNHQAKIRVKDNSPKGSIFEIQFHAV
jgi:K+-sensing histidine kinase KdpD